MSVTKTSGVTISFTADEVDWLNWVLTEVLGKATHVPAHDAVKAKIVAAVDLVRDVNAAIKGGLDDTAVREGAGGSSST